MIIAVDVICTIFDKQTLVYSAKVGWYFITSFKQVGLSMN